MGNITSAVPSMKELLAEEALEQNSPGYADEGAITAAVPRLMDLLHEEEEARLPATCRLSTIKMQAQSCTPALLCETIRTSATLALSTVLLPQTAC